MSSRERYAISLALLLIVSVGGIMAVAVQTWLSPELRQVIMILAGMLGMAAATIFARFIEGGDREPAVRLKFDEAQTRQALRSSIDVDYEEIKENEPATTPWEPTTDTLLAEDASLALAKLRIDLERELRRLAFEEEAKRIVRPIGIPRLLDLLVKKKILNEFLVSAIKDILPACNQAIHGAEVPLSIARSVLSVGEEVVKILRSMPRNAKADIQTNELTF